MTKFGSRGEKFGNFGGKLRIQGKIGKKQEVRKYNLEILKKWQFGKKIEHLEKKFGNLEKIGNRY